MNNIYMDNIKVFNDLSPEEINNISIFFNKNDYVLLKNILTPEIKKYLETNITFDEQNSLTDKLQFYRAHHDNYCSEFISKFNKIIHPFYEIILNKKLSKIIGFGMNYFKDSDLIPHYDNYNMPISSTICFHNENKIEYPFYIDKSYFNNPHPFRLTVYDKEGIPEENKIKIDINECDIGIFRGRNHLHWRDKKDIISYKALLLHTEDYMYDGNLISYVHNTENAVKININDIININITALTNEYNYNNFRKKYVMYF